MFSFLAGSKLAGKQSEPCSSVVGSKEIHLSEHPNHLQESPMLLKDSVLRVTRSRQLRRFVFTSLAGSLISAASLAQVTYEGTKPYVYFGSEAVNSTSTAQILNFSIQSGTTVGGVAVVTLGVAGKDFASGSGNTCVPQLYSSTTSCVVNVTMKPHSPGWRKGAVVFTDGSGNTLATVPLYGSGSGPQIAYSPATISTLISNTTGTWSPNGAATDPSGNIWVADYDNGEILKVTSNGHQSTAISGLGDGATGPGPNSIAFDGSGNLYIALWNGVSTSNASQGSVVKYSQSGGVFTLAGTVGTVYNPSTVGVDGSGNVLIGDTGVLPNGDTSVAGPQLVKVTPAGVQSVAIKTGPAGYLNFVVNGAGQLFFADSTSQIHEYTPSFIGVYTQKTVIATTGITSAGSLAIDGGGNFYFMAQSTSDPSGPVLVELTAAGVQSNLFTGTSANTVAAGGIAVDNTSNIYTVTTDTTSDTQFVKFDRSDPIGVMNFATSTAGGSTDSTDGSLSTTIENTGNENLEIYSISYPADFPETTGSGTACAGGTSILATPCTVTIDFTPVGVSGTETSLALREGIHINTNSLNTVPNRITLATTGTETKLTPTIMLGSSLNPSTAGGTVSFTAMVSGSGATPTGTVQFFSGGTWIGTATLSSGSAVFKIDSLGAGSHTITADYSGDAVYAAADSTTVTQVVSKAATTVKLTSSLNPAASGVSVTFTATVARVGADPAPTGTVQFLSGGVMFASGTISGGVATTSTSSLTVGAHDITAVFSGDETYLTETSNDVKETISNPI
jgi:hypothetical protein